MKRNEAITAHGNETRPLHDNDELAKKFSEYCKAKKIPIEVLFGQLFPITDPRDPIKNLIVSNKEIFRHRWAPTIERRQDRWVVTSSQDFGSEKFGIEALRFGLDYSLFIRNTYWSQPEYGSWIVPYIHFSKYEGQTFSVPNSLVEHGIRYVTFYLLGDRQVLQLKRLIEQFT